MSGLTQERLKEVLDYNPETGEFIWKVRKGVPPAWNVKWARELAGCKSKYLKIRIDGVLHQAHRLAFLYVEGDFPPNGVDHINGVGTDNRWKNLRKADSALNSKNQALRVRSKTGVCGVSPTKDGRFSVSLRHERRTIHGGIFNTLEEASARATQLYKELGFSPLHGLPQKERAEFPAKIYK